MQGLSNPSDDRPKSRQSKDGQILILHYASRVGIVIVVGFFVQSNKKSKKTSTKQTGIDLKDLSLVLSGNTTENYQTNRSTAELR